MEPTILRVKDLNSVPKDFTGMIDWQNVNKSWYKEGKLHREDGPAIEYSDGRKYWYKKGKLHSINGPAIEFPDGRKEWYKEGKHHREDGHSIEWINEPRCWHLENKIYSPKELLSLINSSFFLGKEKGQYNLEWLKFLTEKGIKEFPIIPGMKEHKDFKEVFEILEKMENK